MEKIYTLECDENLAFRTFNPNEQRYEPTANELLSKYFHGLSNDNENTNNELVRAAESDEEEDVKPDIKMEENDESECDENFEFRIFDPNEQRYNEPTANEVEINVNHEEEEVHGDGEPSTSRSLLKLSILKWGYVSRFL